MDVLVIGPGAIGSFFATHLLECGDHRVVLAARTPFDELVLETGGHELRHRPPVLTDPAQLPTHLDGPADWVLLATKAHQTPAVAGWLRAAVGPGTTVAVLQNGVEHEARVRPFVGDAPVLPAVVYCGAEVLAPGHVVHRTNGLLIVPEGDVGRRLAALYEGTGARVRLVDDFTSAAWQKLCSNVVANGLTALTGRRMEVFTDPSVAAEARAVARECLAVARAEGATLDDGYPGLLADGLAAMPADSGSSMLYDRLAGRPLEADALYGAVLRAAERHGIEVPRHRLLAALLGALGSPA